MYAKPGHKWLPIPRTFPSAQKRCSICRQSQNTADDSGKCTQNLHDAEAAFYVHLGPVQASARKPLVIVMEVSPQLRNPCRAQPKPLRQLLRPFALGHLLN